MQAKLHEQVAGTSEGARAKEILRSCVHCGFCNATCPTYLLTGDELDGPRGRIYLIKEMLEAGDANPVAQRHLDRCLTCRACETTCPSGVQYGELLELGRDFMEPRQGRGVVAAAVRGWLKLVVPDADAFRRWARVGNWFRWLLPRILSAQLPEVTQRSRPVAGKHPRKVLLLQGCVQQVATPAANDALASLLSQHGIEATFATQEGCCGSLNLHLGDRERALAQIRHNVDTLIDLLPDIDAVVSSASGCGVTYKDYARLLDGDPEYAAKASQLAEKVCDAAEFLASEGLACSKVPGVERVAWHPPCTLQHGQQITGLVERLLAEAGYELTHVADAHLCCGSAGTYSLLQPAMSEALREGKLQALRAGNPDVIATANVGCQTHLASGSSLPVVHWVELLR